MIETTTDNFNEEVLECKGRVLIDFCQYTTILIQFYSENNAVLR